MDIDIISTLKTSSSNSCKYPLRLKDGAKLDEIRATENRLDIKLPSEIFSFYRFSNGAEGDDFIFNILPVEDLYLHEDTNGNSVIFSEYLIYSETCGFRFDNFNSDSFSIVRRIGSTPIANYNFPVPICYSLSDYFRIYSEEGTFGIWT